MKQILIVLVMLISLTVFGQPPGGGGQQNRGNQPGSQKEVLKFNASDAAGIFYYDTQEVVKKAKVKDQELQSKINNALKIYNHNIRQIAFVNTEKFDELDVIMNNIDKQSFSQPAEEGNNTREKIGLVIRPIRAEIKVCEIELNKTLESFLTEKQLKKWFKYQKKKKESLFPGGSKNKERQDPGSRPKEAGQSNGSR